MENIPCPYTVGPTTPDKERARAEYQHLRVALVTLRSAVVPDIAAIDSIMNRLREAQMHYKATFGLRGNNPNE